MKLTIARSLSLFPKTFWLILLFAFISRFLWLSYPPQYYFDEVYHAVTSKLISRNDPRAYEWWNPAPEPDTAVDWLHPPGAKLMQASSMLVFGENSFGWRFSSAVMGTLLIALMYIFARELGFDEDTSLLAMGLLSLDGLTLTLSRIAMNDIHVTFFILLTAYLYWRWRKKPTVQNAIFVGLAAGTSVAMKWSGVFAAGIVILHQIFEVAWSLFHGRKIAWRQKFILALSVAWMVPALYLLAYEQMFWQGKDWAHFKELHNQIWWYQTNLDATHPYQSTPWEWIFSLRPVYAFTASTATYMQNIYLQSNPLLLWFGLLAVLWSISDIAVYITQYLRTLSHALHSTTETYARRLEEVSQLRQSLFPLHRVFFLLICYFAVWGIWIFSPRIMFFYHYLPAIPFLSLLLAWQLTQLKKLHPLAKTVATILVLLIALTYIVFYPQWAALPVPYEPWSSVYYFLPTWQ